MKSYRKKLIILFSALTCVIILVYAYCNIKEHQRITRIYDEACAMLDVGEYSQAADLFGQVFESDYKDAKAFFQFSKAMEAHSNGNSLRAESYLYGVSFHHLPDSKQQKYAVMMETIYADAEIAREKQREEEAIALEKRIVEGVPFVGMPEKRINDTTLGRPTDTGSNWLCRNGQQTITKLYYWFEDGNWIYTARCYDGIVQSVTDDRYNRRRSSVPSSSSKKSYSTTRDDDLYNVNDYSNEEDFYDDHYDDFFDYYEAEDYYREHHN